MGAADSQGDSSHNSGSADALQLCGRLRSLLCGPEHRCLVGHDPGAWQDVLYFKDFHLVAGTYAVGCLSWKPQANQRIPPVLASKTVLHLSSCGWLDIPAGIAMISKRRVSPSVPG